MSAQPNNQTAEEESKKQEKEEERRRQIAEQLKEKVWHREGLSVDEDSHPSLI